MTLPLLSLWIHPQAGVENINNFTIIEPNYRESKMKDQGLVNNYNSKKIWIDLDNPSDVLFFNPIIKELSKMGIDSILTIRNHSQNVELAKMYKFNYKIIGHHYGKIKLLKAVGLLIRSIELLFFIRKKKPDLAFSFESRPQILICKFLGIPTVSTIDYEYVQYLPFAKPDLGFIPDTLLEESVKNYYKKVIKYPGIKEDVYKHNLEPDSDIKEKLNITDNDIVITVRPPATEAHYHTHLGDILFEETINFVIQHPQTRIILLTRTASQKDEIKKKWNAGISSGKIIIPDQIFDGLNLIWHSDLVISGGGTMIREAAALNVPSYSIFGGTIGEVDKKLEKAERISILRSKKDIHDKIILRHKEKSAHPQFSESEALQKIVNTILEILSNPVTPYINA